MAFIGATMTVWLRNHDILRDLYDHATMISAAGKLHAGMLPFVDIRSPMQSSVYYFSWATEEVFGRSYLGLATGGLVQALGGGILIGWMVYRRWAFVPAVIVAGTVMLAGLVQHTEFFYNPIGVICFTLVVIGVGRKPALENLRLIESWVVLVALFVGGTNKLNFQAFALGFGTLLMVRAWRDREISGASCSRQVLLMWIVGTVLPLGMALAWTRATLRAWSNQVLFGPVARWDEIRHAFAYRIFLSPPHNFHHHILLPWIGGFGLLVCLGTGVWALTIRRSSGPAIHRLLIATIVVVGIVGSALLMVTNYETVILTSLAFFISALALYLSLSEPNRPDHRRVGVALLVCASAWTVTGGYAAWHGSRVLYALDPPPRSDYVRLTGAPKPLRYFEGVRFERDHLRSLLALAAKVQSLEDADGHLHGILFGPATEWLERAYPEAIVRGMPIWYHAGTSLAEGELPWFKQTLKKAGVTRIITHPNWEHWPADVQEWLNTEFRREQASERYVIYHPRVPSVASQFTASTSRLDPVNFREDMHSNVLITATQPDPQMRVLHNSVDKFFGAAGDSVWRWPFPVAVLGGVATATLLPTEESAQSATFRIFAGNGADEVLLWELPVELTRRRPEVAVPFNLQASGRRLRLEISSPEAVTAGWTRLHINQSIDDADTVGLPYWRGLVAAKDGTTRPGAPDHALWFVSSHPNAKSAADHLVPFEAWERATSAGAIARITIQVTPDPFALGETTWVALLWYRAGRFEIMTERQFSGTQQDTATLEARLPEPGGWIGVLARPAGDRISNQSCRILKREILQP